VRIILFLLMCLTVVADAASLNVAQNQTLIIRFTGPSPSCVPAPCTRIQVDFGSITSVIPAGSFFATTRIFNGANLLGQELGVSVSALFVSSLLSFPNPGIQIDFTTINNGTIDGRFEVTATSAYTVDDLSAVKVLLETDVSMGGQMQVTSIGFSPAAAPVLSPSSLVLLGIGLLTTAAMRLSPKPTHG
jgi:hypothetical protein